ncbi:tellurite resistance TerB family protein [Labilibacter marinus]|uniref:tellurite resistance TerB family protein n=1 Tax=Labilibacter marinus TaxID=1477105 RepID=UPI0008337D56|nr:TerB family tellurite resistance protein [Labilibacter marinus]
MQKIEKLYEVMGELLYAVAKADGVIQPEEKDALNKLLQNHASQEDIMWSFEYEESKNTTVEEVYNKVINFCHSYGPAAQYQEFINAMTVIAEAADGLDEKESKIINSFSKDLLARFQQDAEKLLVFKDDMED